MMPNPYSESQESDAWDGEGYAFMSVLDLPIHEQHDPGNMEMCRMGWDVALEKYPDDLREMVDADTMEKFLLDKCHSARRYAVDLIDEGETPQHAWRRAVRAIILEREDD